MTSGQTKFWRLFHFDADDTYEERGRGIGLYSSEEKARAAIVQLADKPGFRDHPAGFVIYDVLVDRTGWVDGFVTQEEAKKPSLRLFLADVDGTLVTERKELTPRAVAAVQRLRNAGIAFAITSGRPPRGMTMLIEPLALDDAIAGFNGGVYVNPDLSVIETRTIDPHAARRALQLILDHKLDAWVYTAEDWLLRDPKAPHVEREQHTVQFPPKVVAEFGDALDRAVKIVGISDDLALVKRCEADAQQALGDSVSAARSQPYYLDVTHPNANKGDVVLFMAKRLGIDPSEIATIGDQPNDTLMFKKSGMSIAMGNASDDVKKLATHTTDGYNDEGFAKAIERFVFGDAP